MNWKEVNWDLEYDGTDYTVEIEGWTLKGQSWEKTPIAPKFIYIFIHGLTATVTFKKDIYPLINKLGGVVFGTDHVGHGRSPGTPVSCKISENVEETIKTIDLAKSKYPSLPVIVHGHSMGGLTLVSLLLRRPDFCSTNIDGAILEAPWIAECPQKKINCCEMSIIRLGNFLFPNLRVPNPVILNSNLTDEKWLEVLKKFRYTYKTITPRTFVSATDEQTFVRENIDKYPSDVPLLFLQGMMDNLVEPEMNEVWITKLMNLHKNAKIKYINYKEGPHVILKSKYREECIKNIFDFIESSINKN